MPDTLHRAIEEQAANRGSSWSAMATELLEEAIRMRRAPGIVFADGATGRRAVVAGTGMDVWQVVGSWLHVERDPAALADEYPWLTPMQLNAAIGYYTLYPDESVSEVRLLEVLPRLAQQSGAAIEFVDGEAEERLLADFGGMAGLKHG